MAINRLLPVPFSRGGPLTNPRAPSTSRPLRLLAEPILERHQRLFPRPPDLGAATPILGRPQTIRGLPGGIPRTPRPVQAGVEAAAIVPASLAQANRVQVALRQLRAERETRKRTAIQVVPGPSGLDFASRPRVIPRFRAPARPLIDFVQRGARRDARGPLVRGVLSQQTTAPASTLGTMVRERLSRTVAGGGLLGQLQSAFDESPPAILGLVRNTAIRLPGATRDPATQVSSSDVETIRREDDVFAVPLASDPPASVDDGGGNNLLLIAGVLAIAFLFFRGKA